MSEVAEPEQRTKKPRSKKAEPDGDAKRDGLRLIEPAPSARMGDGTKARARAAAEAVFARDDEDGALSAPPRERIEWLVTELDDFLARVGLQTRLVFVVSLWVLSLFGPLSRRVLSTLASLPLAERVDMLAHLEEGALAPTVLAVKGIFCTLYYEHPDAAREVGFDGACLKTTEVRS